ncbi:MAG: helix-turn-helix domain-containing protein [Elusimicrobiota bacterium]|nr:helix-turn-helix domain-containing protein [Elusimicrobiota bacterium]
MRRKVPQTVGMSRVLSRFIEWAAQAPDGAADYAAQGLILLARVRLGMTQAQLAKRSGLTQSHIANIENGKVDVQLSTLRRIFAALECRLVLAPQPVGDLEELVRRQARAAALKRVKRVSGTMAMEAQRPDEGMLEELVRTETEKLIQSRSSEIWED